MVDILVIPDTQVTPGSRYKHLEALGNLLLDRKPDVIVHLGDHWDMESLSHYDRGKKSFENRRYVNDIEAGIDAMMVLQEPLIFQQNRDKLQKKKIYNPRKIFLIGNHENRINRYIEDNPELEYAISFADFKLHTFGWEIYNYLDIVNINGVNFSHLFLNPDSISRRPFSSSVDYQLKSLGFSFVAGHIPGLQVSNIRYNVDGSVTRGVIAGSFYIHDFDYQQLPQGNKYWRGALYLRDVEDGNFILEELPLTWLLRKYL